MFKRRKQLRRWCHDLIERRDPGHPRFGKDIDSFIKLTKVKTDGELMEQFKLDTVRSVVKDLFARAFRERATALKMKGGKDSDVDVEDWWGTGSEMKQPGGVVGRKGGEAVSNEEQGEGEGREDGGDGMDSEDDEEPKKFEHRLPIRTKGMAS